MAITRYTQGVQNTLEEYVPLPLDMIAKAGAAIQQRGDAAQLANDQTQFGLASTEALAPAHREFIKNYANEYKAKAGELLEKFGNNTSNPEFIRESKRLNTQFASDPRLGVLKQSNDFLKSQQQLAQKNDAAGVKYINPLTNFSGVDEKGNLIAPTQGIRGTNFDEEITKSFLQIKDNMIDNGKGLKSNKPNIDNLAKNWLSNMDGHPVTRDAQQWYMQQGFSEKDAKVKVAGLIQQAYTDNLRTDRDYEYDRLIIAKQQYKDGREDEMFDRRYKMATLAQQQARAAGKGGQGGSGEEADAPSSMLKQQVAFNGNKALNVIVGDQKVLTTHTSARQVGDKTAPRTLKDAFVVDTKAEGNKRGSFNVNAAATQDVMIYLDKNGKMVTADKKSAGVFNPNNKSYRNGNETKDGLKPIAAREYVGTNGKRYYEPLNYQETILSGFDASQNIDFKPLIKGLPNLNTPAESSKSNAAGGKNYTLKNTKVGLDPELRGILDKLSVASGGQGIESEPQYKRVKQILADFNKGKNVSTADLKFVEKFNDDMTATAYEFVNQSSIYPYLEGKPAQTQIAKQFMSPFSNQQNEMTSKQIEKDNNEE